MPVGALRELGHDLKDIRGTTEQGLPDSDLWNVACIEKRLLITTDDGIVIVRLRQPNRHRIHQRVMLAIEGRLPADWDGLLVVMRDNTMSLYRSSDSKRGAD